MRGALVRKGDRIPQRRIVTKREREVLNCLKRGKTNADIAIVLGISENTVKFHMKAIMRKLRVITRSHCVAVAIRRRLISLR